MTPARGTWLRTSPGRVRVLSASLAAALTFGGTRWASAEDAKAEAGARAVPQPAEVDLARLDRELDLFEAEAHRTRVATAIAGLTIGCTTVPAGLILLERTDGVSQALVIGMLVGGSAQLLSVPASLIPTRMDDIRQQLKARIADDAAPHRTVHTIEVEWRDAADAARRKRFRVGGALLTFGIISMGTGLTFLIASEGIFGMTRKAQYTWGGVSAGTGISVSTIGTRFLLEWSPEESAWEDYRTMKADGPPMKGPPAPPNPPKASAGVSLPTLAFVPTPGGALAFASLTF
jgi:hypothetical protein